MNFSTSLKNFREKFAVKVFLQYAVFFIILSVSLTTLFINHQISALRDDLTQDGEMLAKLFAYNSRLGIFSESGHAIQNPVDALFQNPEVLSASVYTFKGTLLKSRERNKQEAARIQKLREGKGWKNKMQKLRDTKKLFFTETENYLEFWMPVAAWSDYGAEEGLLADGGVGGQILGFVEVTMGKEILKKQCSLILSQSIWIAIALFLLGSFISYTLAKKITEPLHKLTEEVKTLGMGGVARNVPVETKDEIGKLATAFNRMASSLKKREEENTALGNRLRHAQKMEAIGTLSGGIAHDFNNILQSVICNVKILQCRFGEIDSANDELNDILASSIKAVNLTRNLLAFSRRQAIKLQPLDVSDTIIAVKNLLKTLARDKIEIQYELAKESMMVMADPIQIDQILMNLTTNARDAMPEGGTIIITTNYLNLDDDFFRTRKKRRPGTYAMISFQDSGVGMDSETVKRIFDPFYTTKREGEGTGLGLSMVFGITQQHNGFVEVESQIGEGATFNIYLPLTESEAEQNEMQTRLLPKKDCEIVLMAEDDEKSRELFKSMLTHDGCKVHEARDGEDAIRKFLENKDEIGLLLFDLIMPKKNGKEAYDIIKKIRPDIKVIFMSGYSDELIEKTGIALEGISFISKPVEPDKLLTLVKEELEK